MSRGPLSRLLRHYPSRILAYYITLFGLVALFWASLSDAGRTQVSAVLADFSRGSSGDVPTSKHEAMAQIVGSQHASAGLEAIIAAAGALLLTLPVAWVYMFTRPRKGYRQAIVHTLVLMPVIVAGIVVLVKNSLALAFGLAAIVGAIRFRNTLDDSRDTIFVLGAMGLGLAAAVQLEVAVVMSVTFNVIVLVLFYTDFARTPPSLEGVRAQRHMERALETANRTSQFVAVMDDRILQSMAPAQLDALADRVRKRRDQGADGLPTPVADRYPTTIRILTSDIHGLRDTIEPILDGNVKRWRFAGSTDEAGGVRVEYAVKMPKGLSANSLVDILRTGGVPYVADVSIG